MENKDNITEQVYRKYLEGNCNKKEENLLLEYFRTSDEQVLRGLIGKELQRMKAYDADATYEERVRLKRISDKVKERIGEKTEEDHAVPKKQLRVFLWSNAAAAIAVFLVLCTVYYSYIAHHGKDDSSSLRQDVHSGIAPQTMQKGALLIVDGARLMMDSSIEGIVVTSKGIADELGNVVFRGPMANAHVELNVPKGVQCRIKLADGTQIWMNSSSKLSFLGTFNSAKREVELEGEAYFEVAKRYDAPNDKRIPFLVQSSDQQVMVLGTKFNVKAYHDEHAIRTTLVEGSVKVLSKVSADSVLLAPGKESYVYENGKVKVQKADLAEALAWKNGEFKFNGEDIHDVMRKVARHYDIDVVYADNVSKEKFVGVLSQGEELPQLLDMLSSIGNVQFKVEGNRILVSGN